jgi:hypothetical protein
MKAAKLNFDLLDSYLNLLDSLTPDRKLELISWLSNSMKRPKKNGGKSIQELYGAFISKQSADEILANLKLNRSFKNNREEL